VAYISGCDETFRGIRVSDGREVLNVPVGAYMGASTALMGTGAYVGTFENEVIAIDMKTRKVTWTYRHPDRLFPYYSSAALSQGRIVLGGRDKMIHALDAKTGKAHWTFMTNARVESSPAIVANRVFVGSTDGRLYVLDLLKGEKLWDFDAGSAITASPAVSGDRLVVGTHDGLLYCLG
jgi:eukaryotic-like serine/threonine-protein kinase